MDEEVLAILATVSDDIPVKVNGEEIGTAYLNYQTGNLEMRLTETAAQKLFRPDAETGAFGMSVATEINLATSEIVEEGATL